MNFKKFERVESSLVIGQNVNTSLDDLINTLEWQLHAQEQYNQDECLKVIKNTKKSRDVLKEINADCGDQYIKNCL